MKKRLLKFALPISLGLMLLIITIFGLISTTFVRCQPIVDCKSGELKGNDDKCYSCSAGDVATYSPVGNCSNAIAGVYCCTGGGGSSNAYCDPGYTYNYSSEKCCPNSAPYYYPGTHGGTAGCYASCSLCR